MKLWIWCAFGAFSSLLNGIIFTIGFQSKILSLVLEKLHYQEPDELSDISYKS